MDVGWHGGVVGGHVGGGLGGVGGHKGRVGVFNEDRGVVGLGFCGGRGGVVVDTVEEGVFGGRVDFHGLC